MPPLIPDRESLTVEFKIDRGHLHDRDLVAAVVCLANSAGGEIDVGVAKDGTLTGLHPSQQNVTAVMALSANPTSPPLTVRADILDIDQQRVANSAVPKARQLVATAQGLLQRRRLKADGTPEGVPLYPQEVAPRQADLGLLDDSALPVVSAARKPPCEHLPGTGMVGTF
jgi:ATP-dependent DNA helicase RecG